MVKCILKNLPMCADSGHIVIFVQCSSVHLHRCTYGCLKQFSLSAILEVNQKHDFFHTVDSVAFKSMLENALYGPTSSKSLK